MTPCFMPQTFGKCHRPGAGDTVEKGSGGPPPEAGDLRQDSEARAAQGWPCGCPLWAAGWDRPAPSSV